MRSPRLQPTTLCRLLIVLSLLGIAATIGQAEKLPIKSYTTADGLAAEYIDCIVRDSHGFLWFCTREGLSRFDGYSFVNYGREQGLPASGVVNLVERRDGTYWVATTNGVCRFSLFAASDASVSAKGQSNVGAFGILTSSPRFDCYRPDANAQVTTIVEDGNGVLWCGTVKRHASLDHCS